MAKITVHVVDESGAPVVNAPVRTGTISGYSQPSGWWGYESEYREISIPADKNGIAEIFIPSTESGVVYRVEGFPGYYGGGGHYDFKKVGAGPWQPWNPTVELVLKKIGVQVPMYARKVGGSMPKDKIPATNAPVGFDLMIGDWVKPYGNGETSDFVFQLDQAIVKTVTNSYTMANGQIRIWTRKYYDNRLSLRFSNDGDGIQFVVADTGSALRLPRLAPTEGYQPSLKKRTWDEEGNLSGSIIQHTDYNKDANYFFRVRTKRDSSGNITNAMYGKIYGDFTEDIGPGLVTFSYSSFTYYYLNPEPNSRNMEFNTKSNLFKNLTPMERVDAP